MYNYRKVTFKDIAGNIQTCNADTNGNWYIDYKSYYDCGVCKNKNIFGCLNRNLVRMEAKEYCLNYKRDFDYIRQQEKTWHILCD